ncbi:enoyl-CoA hydratase/isomerase family protein, partial [Ameyamaea chiangmaiensis]
PKADVLAAIAQETRLVGRLLAEPDFAEGVRARVIDKDRQPRWAWPTAAAVPDALVDDILGTR